MLYKSIQNKNTSHQTCGKRHNVGQSIKIHAGTNQPVRPNTWNSSSKTDRVTNSILVTCGDMTRIWNAFRGMSVPHQFISNSLSGTYILSTQPFVTYVIEEEPTRMLRKLQINIISSFSIHTTWSSWRENMKIRIKLAKTCNKNEQKQDAKNYAEI